MKPGDQKRESEHRVPRSVDGHYDRCHVGQQILREKGRFQIGLNGELYVTEQIVGRPQRNGDDVRALGRSAVPLRL